MPAPPPSSARLSTQDRVFVVALGLALGLAMVVGTVALTEATDQVRASRRGDRSRRAPARAVRVVAPRAPRWPRPPLEPSRPVYIQEDHVPEHLRPGEAEALPADWLARLEAELASRERYVVTRRYRPLEPLGRPPAGAPPLMHPDPLHWKAFLDAMPSIREFRRWIVDGGRVEDLPGKLVTRLKEIDASLAELGMSQPFYPYLSMEPAEEPFHPPPGVAGVEPMAGWAGAALRAHAEAEQRHQAAELRAREVLMGSRDPEGLPGSLRGMPLGVPLSLRDYLGVAFVRRKDRLAIARWLAPATRAVRRMLWAAGRSMREEPATRQATGTFFYYAVGRRRELWFSSVGFERPVDLLGGRPGTLQGWMLHTAICEASRRVRENAGVGLEEVLDETEEGWRRCAATPSTAPDYDEDLVIEAVCRLGSLQESRGDWPGLAHTFLAHAELLLDSGHAAVPSLLDRVTAVWDEGRRVDPPRPARLEEIARWVKRHAAAIPDADRVRDLRVRVERLRTRYPEGSTRVTRAWSRAEPAPGPGMDETAPAADVSRDGIRGRDTVGEELTGGS